MHRIANPIDLSAGILYGLVGNLAPWIARQRQIQLLVLAAALPGYTVVGSVWLNASKKGVQICRHQVVYPRRDGAGDAAVTFAVNARRDCDAA